MTTSTQAPDGWADFLHPGETILWQGRPEPGLSWGDLVGGRMVEGLAMIGFALFWMSSARSFIGFSAQLGSEGDGGLGQHFSSFGLLFVAMGLYLAVGVPLWKAVLRRRTWYTLTDRAAYIATDLLGRKLDRHELRPDLPLQLEDAEPGTVWFAERVSHDPGGWRGIGDDRRYETPSTTRHPIGFERIPDARAVWRLMQNATKGQVRDAA
jgi:hypothetical protein